MRGLYTCLRAPVLQLSCSKNVLYSQVFDRATFNIFLKKLNCRANNKLQNTTLSLPGQMLMARVQISQMQILWLSWHGLLEE